MTQQNSAPVTTKESSAAAATAAATTAAVNQIFQVYQGSDKQQYNLTSGLMVPGGGPIQIQGTTLSALTNGNIQSIECVADFGAVYTYRIIVYGNSHEHVNFTDLSGDTYSLQLESPVAYNHTLDYNSSRPEINIIQIVNRS